MLQGGASDENRAVVWSSWRDPVGRIIVGGENDTRPELIRACGRKVAMFEQNQTPSMSMAFFLMSSAVRPVI